CCGNLKLGGESPKFPIIFVAVQTFQKLHKSPRQSLWAKPPFLQFILSTIIAIPCPPPMQAVASPYFFFRRRNSYNKVITRRVPVAPSGCPNAIAPPFTFTFSR